MGELRKGIRERGFGVGIAAFLAVFGLTAASFIGFWDLNRQVVRSHNVLFELNKVQRLVERLEAAGRGYLLTHDPRFAGVSNSLNANVEHSFGRLRTLLASSPGHLAILDEMQALADRRASELEELYLLSESERARAVTKDFDITTVRKLRDQAYRLEEEEDRLLHERQDDSNLLAVAATLFTTLGAALALYLTVTSYNRLRESSREWKVAREAAVEASRMKSDFLTTMSHEIRTPMNGVTGMATLLMKTPLDSEQASYVRAMKTSADSLLGLINQILDHAKIEAGKLELECQDFEFKAVFDSVLGFFRYLALAKGIDLRLTWPDALPHAVWGDRDRLRQVLVNLIGNAMKFTSSFVEVKVTRLEIGVSQTFRVDVTDNGPGIPMELQPRLFERFSQVGPGRSAGQTPGSGLGLMISKELVQAMGGEIGVDSEDGRGSRFWFTVRLGEARSPALATEARARTITALKGRVLVAEDQPVNQAVIGKFLESFGLSVKMVVDGREAVDAALSGDFDLILMDCQMPGMDGFTATSLIRGAAPNSGRYIPIIALTAKGMVSDRERCFAAGMNDFISKPVEIDRLHMVLERFLPSVEPEFSWTALEALGGFESEGRPLVETLTDDFFKSGSEALAEIDEAIRFGDLKRVSLCAHALKSTSRTLGLVRLGDLCAAFEREPQTAAATHGFAELQASYNCAREWLTRQVFLNAPS